MVIENKEHEQIWGPINWESPYIQFCERILKNLPEKDVIFIKSYYYLGKTEDEIAPLLGLSNQSSVNDFKKRIFARIRMYMCREYINIPGCIQNRLRTKIPLLFDFYIKIQKPNFINKISEDYYTKLLVQGYIHQLLSYFKNELILCGNCASACYVNIKKDKIVSKILGIAEHSILQDIEMQIKQLQYLLSWRVFDETN